MLLANIVNSKYIYFVAENLVLPPGCRPYPTGRKLGQVRDNRLCREHMSRNDGILECRRSAYGGLEY